MDVVNVESANLDDLKKRFVEICATINRPGMEDLMAWLERSDFYTAPASTRFHGNYTGGLLEHSLNVYDKLSGFVARYPELEISPETVAVTALFHDLTKVNYYTVSSRNVKDDVTGAWHKEPFYKTEDRLPLGHGEKSVIILQSFIKLTRDEIFAIRWHISQMRHNCQRASLKSIAHTVIPASASTTGYATAPSQNSDFANVGEEDGELPF